MKKLLDYAIAAIMLGAVVSTVYYGVDVQKRTGITFRTYGMWITLYAAESVQRLAGLAR